MRIIMRHFCSSDGTQGTLAECGDKILTFIAPHEATREAGGIIAGVDCWTSCGIAINSRHFDKLFAGSDYAGDTAQQIADYIRSRTDAL